MEKSPNNARRKQFLIVEPIAIVKSPNLHTTPNRVRVIYPPLTLNKTITPVSRVKPGRRLPSCR